MDEMRVSVVCVWLCAGGERSNEKKRIKEYLVFEMKTRSVSGRDVHKKTEIEISY